MTQTQKDVPAPLPRIQSRRINGFFIPELCVDVLSLPIMSRPQSSSVSSLSRTSSLSRPSTPIQVKTNESVKRTPSVCDFLKRFDNMTNDQKCQLGLSSSNPPNIPSKTDPK